MDNTENELQCMECGMDMEDDDGEVSCSNPRSCAAQVDMDELLLSLPPGKPRQTRKARRAPKVVTEAFLVDLVRRGKYKAYIKRRRNSWG